MSHKEKACAPHHLHVRGQGTPPRAGRAWREVSPGLARAAMTSPGQDCPYCCLGKQLLSKLVGSAGLRVWFETLGHGESDTEDPKPVPGSAAGDAWRLGTSLGEPLSRGA